MLLMKLLAVRTGDDLFTQDVCVCVCVCMYVRVLHVKASVLTWTSENHQVPGGGVTPVEVEEG